MKSEKMYIVWAHPRADSLTAHIVEAMQSQAARHAIDVTTLDLYRRGFNPVLDVEDEPDWENPNKQYSPDVHQLYSELEGHDTLVVVFPLWWYSYPAMIKGYMDRVWNHGLAYGGKGFPAKKNSLGGVGWRLTIRFCEIRLGKKHHRFPHQLWQLLRR